MKYIIVILLTGTLFSCDQTVKSDKKKSTNEAVQSVDLKMNLLKTDKLFGEWTIYVVVYGNSSTYCNGCPKVNFNSDGTMDRGLRKWKVMDKRLVLTSGNPDGPFPDTEYEMYYEPESNFTRLTLTQVEKKYSLVLGRN